MVLHSKLLCFDSDKRGTAFPWVLALDKWSPKLFFLITVVPTTKATAFFFTASFFHDVNICCLLAFSWNSQQILLQTLTTYLPVLSVLDNQRQPKAHDKIFFLSMFLEDTNTRLWNQINLATAVKNTEWNQWGERKKMIVDCRLHHNFMYLISGCTWLTWINKPHRIRWLPKCLNGWFSGESRAM